MISDIVHLDDVLHKNNINIFYKQVYFNIEEY